MRPTDSMRERRSGALKIVLISVISIGYTVRPWWAMRADGGVSSHKFQTQTTMLVPSSAPAIAVQQLPTPPRHILVGAKIGRNRRFAENVAQFRDNAMASGMYSDNDMYTYDDFPDFILNDPVWSRHVQFSTDNASDVEYGRKGSREGPTRGGGYWFWKPVIIAHHLAQLNYGDILEYVDNDFNTIGDFKRTRFIANLLLQRNATFAGFTLDRTEEQTWTKADILYQLCPSNLVPLILRTDQYIAGLLVIRKTPGTMALLEQWRQAAQDYHLISDEPSKLPNLPGFRENRHDQSLLNVLLKCHFYNSVFQRQSVSQTLMHNFSSSHHPRWWSTFHLYTMPM